MSAIVMVILLVMLRRKVKYSTASSLMNLFTQTFPPLGLIHEIPPLSDVTIATDMILIKFNNLNPLVLMDGYQLFLRKLLSKSVCHFT